LFFRKKLCNSLVERREKDEETPVFENKGIYKNVNICGATTPPEFWRYNPSTDKWNYSMNVSDLLSFLAEIPKGIRY